MKLFTKILPAFLVLLSTFSCERNIPIGIGEEITIPFGKTASLYNYGYELRIEFTQLVEESRCQPGTVCFWEGRAVVEIELNNYETFELVFSTESDDTFSSKFAEYQDYTIELIDVLYETDDDFGIEKKYSIIVEVNN